MLCRIFDPPTPYLCPGTRFSMPSTRRAPDGRRPAGFDAGKECRHQKRNLSLYVVIILPVIRLLLPQTLAPGADTAKPLHRMRLRAVGYVLVPPVLIGSFSRFKQSPKY